MVERGVHNALVVGSIPTGPTISRQDVSHFMLAYYTALQGPGVRGKQGKYKLGAVLVQNGIVRAARTNALKTHPFLTRYTEWPYLHAEASAVIKAGKEYCQGATIYVARARKNGMMGTSRPCVTCQVILRGVNVTRMVYYSADNTIVAENVT